jgi:dolichol-phosphate mannosyltransferase
VTDVPELIVLGVIGEYVGRTYVETKGRPLYIVNREAGLADRLSSPERIVSSPPFNLTEADPPARND